MQIAGALCKLGVRRQGGGDYVSPFFLSVSQYLRLYRVVMYMNTLGEVLGGVYDPLARLTTQVRIVTHDGAVIRKARVRYANRG